jgi:glucose uptake protein GlcU
MDDRGLESGLSRFRYRGGDYYNEDPMKPSALSLAVALVILPQASQGQRIASLTHFAPPDSTARHYPATYFLEGAVIGTSLLATTGAWIWSGLCDTADCGGAAITGALIAGAVGAAAGALVGGMVNAPHPRPLHGHAAKAALVGTLAGAMWGFGLFTHFCADGCNPSEVRFGISTAAVGALGGLLVGL